MKHYDWIAIGGGMAGAALGYELVKKGLSVLAIEQDARLQGATRFSYGGLAFWSGTTDLTRQLCQAGIERHRNLSEELAAETQFRELDLVMTIAATNDPEKVAASYAHFAIPPHLLTVSEACQLEPLLNPQAISGALTVRHGHISPEATVQAYYQAMTRLGGEIEIKTVSDLLLEGDRIIGVRSGTEIYRAANVVVCAGGFSRNLLKTANIRVPQLYFTHAELLETPPVSLKLNTIVMPAILERFNLEAVASREEVSSLWDEPDREVVPPILDAGAIQFQDGSLRIGQISRTLSNPHAGIDPQSSEADLRRAIGKVLPALEKLPGTWHRCLVAFSGDRLPLMGALEVRGLHLFSGMSNPLVIIPPLAEKFANWATGMSDDLMSQLSPMRSYKSESDKNSGT